MNRRHFLQQAALVCAGLGMGCQRQPDTLRVGINSWTGYQTLYLAKTFGWLPNTTSLVATQSLTDSQQAQLGI